MLVSVSRLHGAQVLSVAKALSIQAHPDKALAEQLHARAPQVLTDWLGEGEGGMVHPSVNVVTADTCTRLLTHPACRTWTPCARGR